MPAAPTDAQVAAALLATLGRQAGASGLSYAEAPVKLRGGARLVYAFRLANAPPRFAGPLVLRVFWRGRDPEAPRRELAVHGALRDLSYPAPRVLLADSEGGALERPFSVMERLPGRSLIATMSPLALVLRLPSTAARLQHELHALDAEAFLRGVEARGVPRRELTVAALLDRLARRVARDASRAWLEPGLRWLREGRPPEPERPVICHGDLPSNTLVERGAVTGVLDWTGTCVAAPELAVAYNKVGMLRASELPAALRPLAPLLQRRVRTRYVAACRRNEPLDGGALDYYEALARFGRMLFRPRRAREHLERFRQITGVVMDAPVRAAAR